MLLMLPLMLLLMLLLPPLLPLLLPLLVVPVISGASQGVCELGVYGALLRDDCGADLLNCSAGYLLRTKRAEGNETGVAAVSLARPEARVCEMRNEAKYELDCGNCNDAVQGFGVLDSCSLIA
jgi:hypothetical protein